MMGVRIEPEAEIEFLRWMKKGPPTKGAERKTRLGLRLALLIFETIHFDHQYNVRGMNYVPTREVPCFGRFKFYRAAAAIIIFQSEQFCSDSRLSRAFSVCYTRPTGDPI
jgi:hypothetical protein